MLVEDLSSMSAQSVQREATETPDASILDRSLAELNQPRLGCPLITEKRYFEKRKIFNQFFEQLLKGIYAIPCLTTLMATLVIVDPTDNSHTQQTFTEGIWVQAWQNVENGSILLCTMALLNYFQILSNNLFGVAPTEQHQFLFVNTIASTIRALNVGCIPFDDFVDSTSNAIFDCFDVFGLTKNKCERTMENVLHMFPDSLSSHYSTCMHKKLMAIGLRNMQNINQLVGMMSNFVLFTAEKHEALAGENRRLKKANGRLTSLGDGVKVVQESVRAGEGVHAMLQASCHSYPEAFPQNHSSIGFDYAQTVSGNEFRGAMESSDNEDDSSSTTTSPRGMLNSRGVRLEPLVPIAPADPVGPTDSAKTNESEEERNARRSNFRERRAKKWEDAKPAADGGGAMFEDD